LCVCAVRFCEISAWNSKIRCRERQLRLLSPQSRKLSSHTAPDDSLHAIPGLDNDSIVDKLIRLNRNSYEASIYDLRMLTNYTFSVKADFDMAVSPYHPVYGKNPDPFRPYAAGDGEDFYRNVIVETKSCKSFEAMSCLSLYQCFYDAFRCLTDMIA
jgi:hypothetical protein